jgi:hypothetical protein
MPVLYEFTAAAILKAGVLPPAKASQGSNSFTDLAKANAQAQLQHKNRYP